MKLLLDVYTSLIFRFSFALPVSFVYGKYSVRVKRKIFGKCEWDRQKCGTSGTGGTSEGNCGTNLCQRGIDNYYQTFINKILIMNIETHYKKLITQLVPTCSYKKNLENISFYY